jgi:hypothetical protein
MPVRVLLIPSKQDCTDFITTMNDKKLLDAFINQSHESRDIWIPKEIAVVDNITPLEFYREYVGRNVPVVIKSLLA